MMKLAGQRVLVTGAGGFIGSHLVEGLARQGCQVRALVRYNSQNSWGWLEELDPDLRRRVEVVAGDVCDPHMVRRLVDDVETVFHLAALIAIPYSYVAPGAYVETNIKGTLNLLEAARTTGVKRFLQTSTSEVYGTAQFVPITEEHPTHGQSPYSATKIGADQLAISFHRSFEFPVTIVRPFNTYGPRQSARAVIPTIITQLLSGKTALKLGSRHPTRDFNYVGDTVRAFMALAEAENTIGEVVNIGSNFEISVGDTVDLICSIIGVMPDIKTDDDRLRPKSSEVERLWAENAKILRLTSWKPEFAGREGLRKGLERTIDWFKTGQNLAKYKAEIYNL